MPSDGICGTLNRAQRLQYPPAVKGEIMDPEHEDSERKHTMMGAGIAIGVGVGVAIGAAMGNVGVGIAIGIAIGVAIGATMGQKKNG